MAENQDVTQAYAFLNCYVQRFSTTFGINNSPTTVELTLVPGNPLNTDDVAGAFTPGASNVTGFNFALAQPGRMSGFEVGDFNFAGIIESYEYNSSPAGRTYTVRMIDPRFLLDNTEIVLDPKQSFNSAYISNSGLENFLDIYHYYDNPQEINSSSEDGVTFKAIRDFLTTSTFGLLDVSGKKFQLQFGNSFLDFSAINFSGIPTWYRINEPRISLGNLIQKVASDFNKDWYAFAKYDTYTSSPNGIQTLKIEGIERSSTTPAILDNHIANLENSGTLISYKRGKELRQQPNNIALIGPPELQWKGVDSVDMQHFWGLDDKDGIALRTPINSNSGIVLLEHIQNNIATGITSTVNIVGTSYIRYAYSDSYPPSMVANFVNRNATGYYPSYNTLDAALFSQDSWEAVLWEEDPTFAAMIGITRPKFKNYNEYGQLVTGFVNNGASSVWYQKGMGTPLFNSGPDIDDRNNRSEALINAVYSATKEVADNHYGKTWLFDSTPSERSRTIPIPSTGWRGNQQYPEIDYEVVNEGWLDPSGSYPYGLDNTAFLSDTNNAVFKNSDGRINAFAIIDILADLPVGPRVFRTTGPIDTSFIDRNSSLIFNSEKFVIPINVVTYGNKPDWGILETRDPIQVLPYNISGYAREKSYYEFLRYMGYPEDFIIEQDLLKKADENSSFGLFPPRAIYIPYDEDGFSGCAVPIQDNYNPYGPFMQISTASLGTKVIQDSSITPWNYGSRARMAESAYEYVNQNIVQEMVLDSAQITNAGIPQVNIGQQLTDTSTVTSLGFQIGPDGLTTNYTLRTYALPPFKINKKLSDKTSLAFVQNLNNRQIIDLSKIRIGETNKGIYKPSQIQNVKGTASTSPNNFIGGQVNPSGKVSNVS